MGWTKDPVPPVARADGPRHDGGMGNNDNRRHPRITVALAAVVSSGGPAPVVGVIDISEGGASLEWSLDEDIAVGTPVRLCFLVNDDQAIELDGRFVRAGDGRAGVEFLPAQQDTIRQLLAETRWDD